MKKSVSSVFFKIIAVDNLTLSQFQFPRILRPGDQHGQGKNGLRTNAIKQFVSYFIALVLFWASIEMGFAAVTSDDFSSGVLNSQIWTVVDPVGDGTVQMVGVGTPNAQLLLSVPAGTDHDVWTSGNRSLRVMQPVTDEDFEIQVKFESEPTQKYQMQGLLAEQDSGNFVRFDVYSDGNNLKIFGAHFTAGSPSVVVQQSITAASTIYLRLSRSGDQWTGMYSYDGVNWITAASFTRALATSSVGVFSGNDGSNPAFTAIVDYFFDTSAPIVPEDSLLCNPGDQFTLTTVANGSGTVTLDPNQGNYSCGDTVTLTAMPDPGATFINWSGDAAGATNPLVVPMNANTNITANFQLDQSPPVISDIVVMPEETSATISWSTDEPTTGIIEYGLTSSYELGSVASSILTTAHLVNILGLTTGTEYHYRIIAEDDYDNSASTNDATFIPINAGIASDDFSTGVLDSQVWTVVDPVGDGTVQVVGAGTTDAQLLLSVPAGTDHDVWRSGNRSLRVMQAIADENFEVEVKFESEPTQKYQMQGLLAEQDTGNFIRFDVYSDGSILRIFGAHFTGGSPSVVVQQPITAASTIYLRLSRSGDQWTGMYSYDGVNWVTAANFTRALATSSVGVFSGNDGSNPAFTAIVDYFFDTASPIIPEDSTLPIANDDSASTNVDVAIDIDVLSNDLDNDGTLVPSSVLVTSGPNNGATSVNPTNGVVTYSPASGFAGNDTFTYTVEDNDGNLSNTATVNVTVAEQLPVANDDSASTDVDVPVDIDVLSNDLDSDGTLVPASVLVTSGPNNGATSVNPTNGVVTYIPDTSFVGNDSFTYTVEDNDGNLSNAATVNVSVVGVAPVANDDSASTNVDVPVDIDVLSNDLDSDGTLVPASVLVTSGPNNGATSVNPTNGVVTYSPASGFAGNDTFTYTVEDNDGNLSNTATVNATVAGQLPVANDDSASTNVDVPVDIDVLSNDLDSDGTLVPASVLVISGPNNGATSVNPTNGVVTYSPASGFAGNDTFTYTVEDNDGNLSNTATVNISVAGQPPVANYDSASTNVDVPVDIDVLSNDLDNDGTLVPSSVLVTSGPGNGTISVDPGTGIITYIPSLGFVGSDSFTYTVEDNDGNVSNTAGVDVTVLGLPPVANDDSASTDVDVSVNIDVLSNDVDSDGVLVPASVMVTSGPSNGTTNVDSVTGIVHYTPDPGFSNSDVFTYTVEDDMGLVSNEATVIVVVGPQLLAPVSDDFSTGVLNSQVWTVVDPVGDGTVQLVGAGTTDAQLLLTVPAGTEHDVWTSGNNALRVMQPVSDEDFEIEVKFESEPTQRYQMQGLLVEQDAGNLIRFDVYSDGSILRIFGAYFTAGTPSVVVQDPISSASTTYLRLTRVADQWTGAYSYDGINWVVAANFTRALVVSSVGVYSGNDGSNPAYTAIADYFFDTTSPIVPEDPTCNPADQFTLTTTVDGSGTITREPDQASYNCGDTVTLTALPAPGIAFMGWSGDISGSNNPVVVAMNTDTNVTANFQLDQSPPVITGVAVLTGETSATISWNTDELSTGMVEYGLTSSYELGSVASSTLATGHSVNILGLSMGSTYHYQITAVDQYSNSASTNDATFVPTAGMASDDFSTGVLNSVWTIVDPIGDGTVQLSGTGNGQLLLSVPAGTDHDVWTSGNRALRIMQATPDEDFEMEVKFESEPTLKYQLQGLLAEQDAENFIRLDIHHNGNDLRIFGAHFTAGTPSVVVQQSIVSAPKTYLRLARGGDQWTAQYSYDGVSWMTAASFTRSLTLSSAGVFSGNSGPNPAYTAIVDYFFDTTSPIIPEDPLICNPADQFTLTANTSNEHGIVTRTPDQASYSCRDVVTLTATPNPNSTFVKWSGDIGGDTNPVVISMDVDTTVTANFQLCTSCSGEGPDINVWYGNNQVFGTAGITQRFINILGNVQDDDNVSTLTYSLNSGPELPLTIGGDGKRLIRSGDFNVEIETAGLLSGSHQIALRAIDTLGNERLKAVNFDYINNVVPPMSYTIDWNSVSNISDVAQIVDGKWALSSAGVRTIESGYDRLIAIGDLQWTNYEALVEVTVHAINFSSAAFGLGMRWTGHFDWDGSQPRWGWLPLGAIGWYRTTSLTSGGAQMIDSNGGGQFTGINTNVPPMQTDVKYIFKMRGEALSPDSIQYSFKFWPSGDAEPPDWHKTWTSGPGDPTPTGGSLLLVAYLADVTFGNVIVTPVP